MTVGCCWMGSLDLEMFIFGLRAKGELCCCVQVNWGKWNKYVERMTAEM